MSVKRFSSMNEALDTVADTERAVLLVVDDSKGIDEALKPLEAVSNLPEIKEKDIKCFLICLTDMPGILDELTDYKVSPTYYFMKEGEEVSVHKGLPKTEKELETAILKALSK